MLTGNAPSRTLHRLDDNCGEVRSTLDEVLGGLHVVIADYHRLMLVDCIWRDFASTERQDGTVVRPAEDDDLGASGEVLGAVEGVNVGLGARVGEAHAI